MEAAVRADHRNRASVAGSASCGDRKIRIQPLWVPRELAATERKTYQSSRLLVRWIERQEFTTTRRRAGNRLSVLVNRSILSRKRTRAFAPAGVIEQCLQHLVCFFR